MVMIRWKKFVYFVGHLQLDKLCRKVFQSLARVLFECKLSINRLGRKQSGSSLLPDCRLPVEVADCHWKCVEEVLFAALLCQTDKEGRNKK